MALGVERFTKVHNFAVKEGFVGAFPNFHQAEYDRGVVYGSILLNHNSAIWRDIPAEELGNPDSSEGRFIAIHEYAIKNGFVGGFPNFHQAEYDGKLVYGSLLIKPEAGEWFDVPSKSYEELVSDLTKIYNEIGEKKLAIALKEIPEISQEYAVAGIGAAIGACAKNKLCRKIVVKTAKKAYEIAKEKMKERERARERERFERMDRTNYELEKFDRWERTA